MKYMYILLAVLAFVSFLKMSFYLGIFSLGMIAGIFIYKNIKEKKIISPKKIQWLLEYIIDISHFFFKNLDVL